VARGDELGEGWRNVITVMGQLLTLPNIDIGPDEWRIVSELLQKHVPNHEVWAFGSRAQRKAKPYSDLDLVLIDNAPLPPDVHAALADELSESDLPWKVDLVDWTRTSDAFRRIIESFRVVLQTAAPERPSARERSG
jgi:type I restriction enzyme S subunit